MRITTLFPSHNELKTNINNQIKTKMEVKQGDTIKVHYTGTLNDGSEFDSSYKRNEPIEFQAGTGQMIQGFDKAVMGMTVCKKKTINIPSTEA